MGIGSDLALESEEVFGPGSDYGCKANRKLIVGPGLLRCSGFDRAQQIPCNLLTQSAMMMMMIMIITIMVITQTSFVPPRHYRNCRRLYHAENLPCPNSQKLRDICLFWKNVILGVIFKKLVAAVLLCFFFLF